MSATPVISLRDVSFERGALPVLDGITLDVREGDFVGIIGPNGGGKTTLLRLTLGLLRPTRGEVRMFDEQVSGPGHFADRIAYLPQRSEIDWSFPTRVIDVVMMGAYGRLGLMRRVPRALRDEAQERLRWLGMESVAERPIGRLSGGQQRRAFLARALMGSPRLMLLDEPCAGLDTESHRALLGQLKDLQRRLGMTVLMVTHDIGEVTHFSDRIACVNHTLHWHDEPSKLGEEVLQSVYACELNAYRLRHDEICPIH